MSQPKNNDYNPGRKAWRDGNLDPKSGEFEQYAARGRELLGSAEEADDLLAELDQALDEIAAGSANKSPDIQKKNASSDTQAALRPIRRWLALAAGLLLLFTIGWWLLQDSTSILDRHFAHYDSNVVVRTLGEPATSDEDEFIRAMAAYDRNDYAAAIPALEGYLATHPEDERTYFFLGLSYLGNDQAEEALPLLARARTTGSPQDAATFYWALAAKTTGQWNPANTSLQELANSSSTFAQKAEELLKE